MKNSGGNSQILLSVCFTIIGILGFYLFKHLYLIPKYGKEESFWFAIVYVVNCFIYLVAILLVNTILLFLSRKMDQELLALSFASAYMLIVVGSIIIGFIEYFNFPYLLLSN